MNQSKICPDHIITCWTFQTHLATLNDHTVLCLGRRYCVQLLATVSLAILLRRLLLSVHSSLTKHMYLKGLIFRREGIHSLENTVLHPRLGTDLVISQGHPEAIPDTLMGPVVRSSASDCIDPPVLGRGRRDCLSCSPSTVTVTRRSKAFRTLRAADHRSDIVYKRVLHARMSLLNLASKIDGSMQKQ